MLMMRWKGSLSPILKAISYRQIHPSRGESALSKGSGADSLIWLGMSNLSLRYDMSLCLKTEGISVLIITGRMVISPDLLPPGPSTLMLGVRIGVPTLGLSACLGRGVPEEELAPRFEFFLTNCSSTTGSDPGDSIVGMRKGFEKPLKARGLESDLRLDRRRSITGRAKSIRECFSNRATVLVILASHFGSVGIGRIPRRGRGQDGGMSGATVVGKKSSQTQRPSLEVPSQMSQGLFGGSARKSTGLQGGAIITWFGEGLARTSEPGDGSVVMARNNFPWLECGKS
ncbi:hypothetical protein FNV43_RR04947 [Rhamnella rubrinervis]|uniref:Uncharacterized protein n=1 Tax=Rhamnella rubrinervis TaxID=2594499 RepID=A0A8K0HN12_9ROSA|nr:hypothetical protein FNV43_RR04947 [Rhamnella rubrinervis]